MPTIDVVRTQPSTLAVCRGCKRAIEWVTTIKNDKRMPVDHPLIVERVTEALDGRLITTIDAARSHFATCPKSHDFRKARR